MLAGLRGIAMQQEVGQQRLHLRHVNPCYGLFSVDELEVAQ
jgi:hypothetical protein